MIHVKLTQNVGNWLTGTELGFIDLTHADAVLGAGTYVQTYPVTPPTQAELDAASAAAITYNTAHRYILGSEFDAATATLTTLTPGPGEIVVGGASGTPLPLMAGDKLARGNRIVALGDSITHGPGQTGLGGRQFADNSWFTWASLLSGGRLRPVVNAGVSSDTTAMMLARIATDVLAYQPAFCAVLGGTNDIGSSLTPPQIVATIMQIVAVLQGARIAPILCTIPPRNDGYNDKIAQFNALLCAEADRLGAPLLDFHRLLVDPATGLFQAGLVEGDGIHPTAAAAKLMGQLAADQLTSRLTPGVPYLARSTTDAANLLANGVFIGDADADGVADSWIKNGVATMSLATGDTAMVGTWQQVVTTDASLAYPAQRPAQQWSSGDTLVFTGLVDISGAAGGQVSARLSFDGTSEMWEPLHAVTQNVTRAQFSVEGPVPSGATQALVWLVAEGGPVTVKWGQLTVLNLTRLGLS